MSLTLSLSQCLPPLAAKLAENSFGSLILSDCRPGWTLGWFLLLRKSSGRLLVSLLLFHLLLFLLFFFATEARKIDSSRVWAAAQSGEKERKKKEKRTLWGEIEIEWERDVPVCFLSEKGARKKSVHFPFCLCPVLVSLFHLDKLIPRFSILDFAVFFYSTLLFSLPRCVEKRGSTTRTFWILSLRISLPFSFVSRSLSNCLWLPPLSFLPFLPFFSVLIVINLQISLLRFEPLLPTFSSYFFFSYWVWWIRERFSVCVCCVG